MVAPAIAPETTKAEPPVGMSMADFIREYDAHGPFELLNGGERVSLSPTKLTHGMVSRALFLALNAHCVANAPGEAFTEIAFTLTDTGDWVKGSRVPDIMFIRADRFAAYKQNTPDWKDKPLILVLDLVVEIVSPTDQPDKIIKKIALYLADGIPLVWLLDQGEKKVGVYRADKPLPTVLTTDNVLDGGGVIPGFRLPVATLFNLD